MKMLNVLMIGAVAAGGAMAGELPQLTEKPWLGCFAGFEGRAYGLAVGADGKSEFYFKQGSKRTSIHSNFKLTYNLEEKVNGKWVRRTFKDDAFETKDEASDEGDDIAFVVEFTGGTKVEVTHEFGKTEFIVGTKIVEKTTENPVRCGVSVMVADLYKRFEDKGKSERDLKKEIDGEVAGETVKGERKKADLYEKPELGGSDYFEGGAKWFSIESEKMMGKEMIISSVNEGSGVIEVNQKKNAYNGFYLNWYMDPAKAETTGAKVKVAVK